MYCAVHNVRLLPMRRWFSVHFHIPAAALHQSSLQVLCPRLPHFMVSLLQLQCLCLSVCVCLSLCVSLSLSVCHKFVSKASLLVSQSVDVVVDVVIVVVPVVVVVVVVV